MDYQGQFISFEGVEGVGKSTVIRHIYQWLKSHNIPVVKTREPGGTTVANKVRKLLLENSREKLTIPSEVLLMFASRSQHVERYIRPHLARGTWVLTDRFVDSSYAYQAGGRNVPDHIIECLDQWVCKQCQPDRVFILDLSIEASRRRIKNRSPDRIESEHDQFFSLVRKAFLDRASQNKDRMCVIDADRKLSCVIEEVKNHLSGYINVNKDS